MDIYMVIHIYTDVPKEKKMWRDSTQMINMMKNFSREMCSLNMKIPCS